MVVAPTPRDRALGTALRQAREHAAVTMETLAGLIDRTKSTISRWESGSRVPDHTDVVRALGALGVRGDRYDEIVAMSRSAGSSEPWLAVALPDVQQQTATLLDIERTARRIVSVSPLLITGALQTAAYARAIMRAAGVPASELETRVAVRVGRRDALVRRKPVHLTALIGEPAIEQRIGGDEVMAEQLQHLLDMGERPNIDVHVVPTRTDWHAALEGPFLLVEQGEGDGTVVHIENRRSGLFFHQKADVDLYRQAADMVLDVAMRPAASAELIAEEMNTLGRNAHGNDTPLAQGES